MGDNELVVTAKSKTFNFELPTDAGINLKHEIYSIIKHNEPLAAYKHGNNIHEHTKKTKN